MDFSFANNSTVVMIVFSVIAVALFLVFLSLFYKIAQLRQEKSLKERIKLYNEKLYIQTMEDLKDNKSTKGVYEKLDLLLSRSQLKYKYSWNVLLLIILILLCFAFGFYAAYVLIEGVVSSLVVAITCAGFPIVAIEVLATMKGKKLKGQTMSLIPILINNAKLSGGDIYKTMKDSTLKTKQPIKMYLEEFVSDYENGVGPAKCFENLRQKVSDTKFRRIMDCLEHHLYKGGNVVVSLSALNKEYLAREVEEDRRKKEHSPTALGILFCVILDFVVVYGVSRTMPDTLQVLKQHDWAIALGMINIMISLYIAYAASTVSSKEKV